MLKTRLFQLKKPHWGDGVVFGIVGLLIYTVIATAKRWESAYQPDAVISLSDASLPLYALYSVARALIAYLLSLIFTLTFGYLAAKNRFAERIIVPLLDIGQSIPVLGFLPGLVLGLVALFPRSNVGLELACVTMIFTGQVWNMTFSYISSLKAVPNQLYEMIDNVGLERAQKLLRLELPCAATGLAWNSLMSMAGGWFFLTVCEAFTLGQKSFRVPGLGSYMALAIEAGNSHAMISGAATMVIVIVFMDFIIWRPIIAWTAKFRLSEVSDGGAADLPFMTLLLERSRIVSATARIFSNLIRSLTPKTKASSAIKTTPFREFVAQKPTGKRRHLLRAQTFLRHTALFRGLLLACLGVALFIIIGKVFVLIEPLRWADWRRILVGTSFTLVRVVIALVIASLWAVPVGILIGLSPRLTRIFQPVIQIGASFPAPMLYPLALGVFFSVGVDLSLGSSFLMLLGVQWYVLFNVLAGSIGISGDLRESFRLIGMSRRKKWTALYLPSVFPFLVTGWVTAAGGAWNASIVSEYLQYRGQTLKTVGLGALISEATAAGNYALLCACLVVMVATVVLINRGLWSRVYQLAETRYRFER